MISLIDYSRKFEEMRIKRGRLSNGRREMKNIRGRKSILVLEMEKI